MGARLAKVVFQPPSASYRSDPNLIWLVTSCGERIPAFWLESKGAQHTLLFSHGNAEDLGHIVRYFKEFKTRLGVNIFAYEYTGYGMSTGQPREAAVYADIEAAFRYLRDSLRIPWQQIIPYGRSIGTAPSVWLAMRTPVRGLVLQSPMLSIYRIPFEFRFTLPGDIFTNVSRIDKVRCPVFIIHGTRDEIVPVWHGQHLYDCCVKSGTAHAPFWVEDADHNNLENMAGEAFLIRFQRFLWHLERAPILDQLREQEGVSEI
mmetsp:Transcript_73220/g.136828  ORF Transcript_73220/g.136828 Transcript_73220/m.136828 type:complete len:261 (-) Transcript_73220:85-867(-)